MLSLAFVLNGALLLLMSGTFALKTYRVRQGAEKTSPDVVRLTLCAKVAFVAHLALGLGLLAATRGTVLAIKAALAVACLIGVALIVGRISIYSGLHSKIWHSRGFARVTMVIFTVTVANLVLAAVLHFVFGVPLALGS